MRDLTLEKGGRPFPSLISLIYERNTGHLIEETVFSMSLLRIRGRFCICKRSALCMIHLNHLYFPNTNPRLCAYLYFCEGIQSRFCWLLKKTQSLNYEKSSGVKQTVSFLLQYNLPSSRWHLKNGSFQIKIWIFIVKSEALLAGLEFPFGNSW